MRSPSSEVTLTRQTNPLCASLPVQYQLDPRQMASLNARKVAFESAIKGAGQEWEKWTDPSGGLRAMGERWRSLRGGRKCQAGVVAMFMGIK